MRWSQLPSVNIHSWYDHGRLITSFIDLLSVFVSLHQQYSPKKRKVHPHLTCAVVSNCHNVICEDILWQWSQDMKATSSIIHRSMFSCFTFCWAGCSLSILIIVKEEILVKILIEAKFLWTYALFITRFRYLVLSVHHDVDLFYFIRNVHATFCRFSFLYFYASGL